MFFVDDPYISEFFKTTVKENSIPVVQTDSAGRMGLHSGTNMMSRSAAIEAAADKAVLLYSTSENAIDWIAGNLGFTGIPEKINLFKNKIKFRKLTESIFPGFFFREVSFENLRTLNLGGLPYPFIIKPAVGFFSMGVYLVSSPGEWPGIVDSIEAEIKAVQGLYPENVLDPEMFIIEECITGEEFAVDAYFDGCGKAVITNILKHSFSSEGDVSDRIYSTSKSIIQDNLNEFTDFLDRIGRIADVKNFPVHLELRRGPGGELLPIEVNPMRFGGWCTTADMSALAFGFNPYLCYYRQEKPDWAALLEGKDDSIFSIVVLDNSTGIDGAQIKSFNYEKLLSCFEKPLEMREIDYNSYPVFGFLFAETRSDNQAELDYILGSNLLEFITS